MKRNSMLIYKSTITNFFEKTLMICVLMIFINTASAQTLLEPIFTKSSADIKNKIENRFNSQDGFESYQIIKVDLNVLSKSKNIELECFGSKIIVREQNKIIRGIKNYSWFGSNEDKTDFLSICVTGSDIQGVITKGNEMFKIETLEGKYILLKINQFELNWKTCGTVHSNHNEIQEKVYHKDFHSDRVSQKLGSDFSSKIRVLVMYTPNASANVSNMRGLAQLCIDQMNQTFINSEISVQVELVHVELTNYEETEIEPTSSATHDNDLTRFTTNGDGYMDEVHILRNEYSADLCVLICDIPDSQSFAGIARSIKSSSQNSFCLVDYWYSFTNLTFAHELGHLIGCRHDENSDPSVLPYSYGHGYSPGGWRTIMGTGSSCNNCPRNPYWSNPSVSLLFGVTGTTNLNDNARVIQENLGNVISHRSVNGTLSVNQSKVNSSSRNTLYHSNRIETNGNVAILPGGTFSLFAGKEISMNPGFIADANSDFTAKIVGNCGNPDGLQNDYALDADSVLFDTGSSLNASLPQADKSGVNFNSLNVFPNPAFNEVFLNIKLSVDCEEVVVSIVDFNGKEKVVDYYKFLRKGNHQFRISIESLSQGVYFVFVKTNEFSLVPQKIIKK